MEYFIYNNGMDLPARRTDNYNCPELLTADNEWEAFNDPERFAENAEPCTKAEFDSLCREFGVTG